MSRYASLTRPRTLLAGYVLFRVGLAALLVAIIGIEAMLDMMWTPEWMAMVVAVPTLAGILGFSVWLEQPWR